jgi:hypothetical protein
MSEKVDLCPYRGRTRSHRCLHSIRADDERSEYFMGISASGARTDLLIYLKVYRDLIGQSPKSFAYDMASVSSSTAQVEERCYNEKYQ